MTAGLTTAGELRVTHPPLRNGGGARTHFAPRARQIARTARALCNWLNRLNSSAGVFLPAVARSALRECGPQSSAVSGRAVRHFEKCRVFGGSDCGQPSAALGFCGTYRARVRASLMPKRRKK